MTESLKYSENAMQRGFPLEFKFSGADKGAGRLDGYGSTFNSGPDLLGDIVATGAFTETLAAHKKAGTTPAMLWQHNPDEPIGVWDELTQDANGLRVSGTLNLATQRGREALSLVKQGAITGLSIGYNILSAGNRKSDGSRLLTKLDLWEVSVVTFPMNRNARLISAKSVTSRLEFERLLKSAGFANAAAKKLALGGWSALASRENLETELLIEKIEKARSELKGLK